MVVVVAGGRVTPSGDVGAPAASSKPPVQVAAGGRDRPKAAAAAAVASSAAPVDTGPASLDTSPFAANGAGDGDGTSTAAGGSAFLIVILLVLAALEVGVLVQLYRRVSPRAALAVGLGSLLLASGIYLLG